MVSQHPDGTHPLSHTNDFQYLVCATPGLFPISPDQIQKMVGNNQDMERAVFCLSSSEIGTFYFPVQAVSREGVVPDLVVDIIDNGQRIATRTFCRIYRGTPHDLINAKAIWQEVHFPDQEQALLYNDIRLSLCSECQRLHKGPCIEQQYKTMGKSLTRALTDRRMAMCTHAGFVYLVVEHSPGYKLYDYAITQSFGLQRYESSSFSDLSSLQDELTDRRVPLYVGWQYVEAKPVSVFPSSEKL